MAPLIPLLALFAILTAVLASPHVSRGVYNHAHRAVPRQPVRLDSTIPKRKRSLNKRCLPRPANSTTSAVLASTAPINVAPLPSIYTSSLSPSPSSADAPSSTSSYLAPSPTTEAPSPSPTTTSTPPPASPTTSSASPPAQTSSSSSSSGEPSYMIGTQIGQVTWYATGLGACGTVNNDGDLIAAVSQSLFDSFPQYNGVNPNSNPVCGKQIMISYQGASVTVTVEDRCTGCAETDLDLSPTAFDKLAPASVGRINVDWVWVS